MNNFYAFNDNKILLILEGMRVDAKTALSSEGKRKEKLHPDSNLVVVVWLS